MPIRPPLLIVQVWGRRCGKDHFESWHTQWDRPSVTLKSTHTRTLCLRDEASKYLPSFQTSNQIKTRLTISMTKNLCNFGVVILNCPVYLPLLEANTERFALFIIHSFIHVFVNSSAVLRTKPIPCMLRKLSTRVKPQPFKHFLMRTF